LACAVSGLSILSFWAENLIDQVLRSGSWSEKDASILVPGDIISIKLGDIIPADARLLEGDPLKIDQAKLSTVYLLAILVCDVPRICFRLSAREERWCVDWPLDELIFIVLRWKALQSPERIHLVAVFNGVGEVRGMNNI
jgi:hypothetical protein